MAHELQFEILPGALQKVCELLHFKPGERVVHFSIDRQNFHNGSAAGRHLWSLCSGHEVLGRWSANRLEEKDIDVR